MSAEKVVRHPWVVATALTAFVLLFACKNKNKTGTKIPKILVLTVPIYLTLKVPAVLLVPRWYYSDHANGKGGSVEMWGLWAPVVE